MGAINLTSEETAIMRELQELSVETILKKRDSGGTPYLAHVFRLHKKIFGQACSACPNKLPTYINKLKKYNMDEQKKTQAQKYRLKKGKVIHILGTKNMYSEHNMTDEVAIELLRENPNRAVLFAQLPENWETEIAKPKDEKPKPEKTEIAKPKDEKPKPEKTEIARPKDEKPATKTKEIKK